VVLGGAGRGEGGTGSGGNGGGQLAALVRPRSPSHIARTTPPSPLLPHSGLQNLRGSSSCFKTSPNDTDALMHTSFLLADAFWADARISTPHPRTFGPRTSLPSTPLPCLIFHPFDHLPPFHPSCILIISITHPATHNIARTPFPPFWSNSSSPTTTLGVFHRYQLHHHAATTTITTTTINLPHHTYYRSTRDP